MYTSTAGVFGDRWAHRTQPTPLAAEVLVDADADAAGATAVTSATRPATSAVAADNLNARNKDLTGLTSHFQKMPPRREQRDVRRPWSHPPPETPVTQTCESVVPGDSGSAWQLRSRHRRTAVPAGRAHRT